MSRKKLSSAFLHLYFYFCVLNHFSPLWPPQGPDFTLCCYCLVSSHFLSCSLLFSPLLLFHCSFFPLLPLFPLTSQLYNVPCLDFNGMCSREAPRSSITRQLKVFWRVAKTSRVLALNESNTVGESLDAVSLTKPLGQFYSWLLEETKWTQKSCGLNRYISGCTDRKIGEIDSLQIKGAWLN